MINVVVNWVLKKDKTSEFVSEFETIQPIVKQEEGCSEYKLYPDLKDDNSFLLYELWQTKEHLQAHLKTPHMVKFFAKTEDWFQEPSDIKVFSLTEEKIF